MSNGIRADRSVKGHLGMRGRPVRFAAGILGALVVSSLAPPPGVVAQDQTSAYAAVEQIFDGMRTANPELVRAVFADDARFALVDTRDGAARVTVQGVDGWIGAIGNSGGSWDEQIYDVEVIVDGAMASVWAPYTFYRDGAISHCGINSIEMLHDGDGWKVTQISDTRRQSDCPNPLG
ncbi:MAG: nuclear transport factor 2 family protein [Gemmatimonadetes bacterium]|nr:nuclear transport factor 2 family protein [Gemmatimonadota bacterium]NNF12294.1 nuclear transport factor 2 family protein [Gemmatimonadota bacterium]NNL31458.1 nuclear transport factor 2 family protein [Gemmatimonadota bacterium]